MYFPERFSSALEERSNCLRRRIHRISPRSERRFAPNRRARLMSVAKLFLVPSPLPAYLFALSVRAWMFQAAPKIAPEDSADARIAGLAQLVEQLICNQ